MSLWAKKIAFESLENRLHELERRVEDAEHHAKILRLEWEETYDKVRHQMSRMSRRVARDTKETGNGTDDVPHTVPENEIDPISAKILLRRGIRRQAE